MRFKSYLAELNDESGSVLTLTGENLNDQTRSDINALVDVQMEKKFSSPESGVQELRKVLDHYNINFPALYDLDPEGDEIMFNIEDYYLYIIYSLDDNGLYDFFAEIVDDKELVEILSDEGDEEEE